MISLKLLRASIKKVYCWYMPVPYCTIVHSKSIETRLMLSEPTNSKRNIKESMVAIGTFDFFFTHKLNL